MDRGSSDRYTQCFFSDIITIVTGFIITTILTLVFLLLRFRKYAEGLNNIKTGLGHKSSSRFNLILFVASTLISIFLLIILFFFSGNSTALFLFQLCSVFVALILFWRQYVIGGFTFRMKKSSSAINLSGRYFHSILPCTNSCIVHCCRIICSSNYRYKPA